MKIPILTSQRIELKPLDRSYCSESYVGWMNDPEVYKYMDSRGNYTLDKLEAYLASVEDSDMLFWAIIIKDSGKHIGNIKIDPVNTVHNFAEYGIMMGDRSEWGKGYAFEASQLVLDYCFKSLKIRKINLGVVDENVNGVRLYKKLGFVVEGVFRKHLVYDSNYYDSIKMALFNPDNIYC